MPGASGVSPARAHLAPAGNAPDPISDATGRRAVGVPVADLWAQPEPGAERVSQLLLAAPLDVLAESGDYYHVEGPDTYRGWIARADTGPAVEPSGEAVVVGDLAAPIYPAPEAAAPLGEAFFGTQLAAGECLAGRRRVLLPDGPGWIPAECLRPVVPSGALLDVEALLSDARRWLGVPYLWGGGSPRGVDCSGYVQILFRVHGRPLLRDARLQIGHGTPVTVEGLQAGDLIFFGRSAAGMPTHVGIALGPDEYIHAHDSGCHCVEISPLTAALDTLWGARHIP